MSEQALEVRLRASALLVMVGIIVEIASLTWRHPTASLAIWSHKLLRWATPWLALLAVGGATWLALDGAAAYWLPVAIAAAVTALAGIGWLVRASGRRPPRVTSVPLAIVIVNVAFLNGWINVVRGRRIEAWHRTDWATSSTPDPPSS